MRQRRLWGAALLLTLFVPVLVSDPSPVADVRSREPLGLSRFGAAVEAQDRELLTLFGSQAALRDVDRVGVLLVPGTPRPLTDGEIGAIERHLDEGASLWLLDETGAAAGLTRPAGITVVPEALLDPQSPFGDPRLVEARVELDGQTFDLILTAATVLDVNTSIAVVLGRSTEAFRDVDRSGAIEAGDPGGEHPILARAAVGRADLLVASDTGIFTNTVLAAEGYDNDALLVRLLEDAPDGALVMDASRHDPPPWLAPMQAATSGLLWVATDVVASILLSAALFGLMAWLIARAPRRIEWAAHLHVLGELIPLRATDGGPRLRRLVVTVLHERTGLDAAELVALSDAELDVLAQRHLGEGQYLSGRGEIGARFAALSALLRPGGPSL